MASLNAALLQMCSTRSVDKNISSLIALAKEAVKMGANYIQSPEMTNIVERDRQALFAAITSEEDDKTLKAVRAFAKDNSVFFHIGSIAIRHGEKAANRAFLINPQGDIIARYDKIHLFDVELPSGENWKESANFIAGEKAVIADMNGVGLGFGICYDLRFPALFNALAKEGASILTAPACFTKKTGEAHWHILQRARAIETGSFMLSAAQAGKHEDGRETYGHSIIINPWGEIIAETGIEMEVIIAKINIKESEIARSSIPNLSHSHLIEVIKMKENYSYD